MPSKPVLRSSESGFTLVEIMFVVALIAVLVAVAIPYFSSESKKARAESEVMPFLTEISTRQGVYAQNHPGYFTPTTVNKWFPIAPSALTVDKRQMTVPTEWAGLRISPPSDMGRCTYYTRGGDASEPAGPLTDTEVVGCDISYDPPATNFFYALAQCETNGDTTHSCYMVTSDNTSMIKKRSGE
jgi:prepilin-type N-terminal cleavage/methylation domain-containing protein